jgi:hypothetical protein
MAEEVVKNSLSFVLTEETPLTTRQATEPPPFDSTMVAAARPINRLATPDMIQKKRFAVFVKILFRELDRSDDSAELRGVAKAIVLDCTRRNRLGDPAYHPLMEAVDQRLRQHVGETHWRKAHLYLHHYMKQDALRRTSSTPVPTSVRTAVV